MRGLEFYPGFPRVLAKCEMCTEDFGETRKAHRGSLFKAQPLPALPASPLLCAFFPPLCGLQVGFSSKGVLLPTLLP